MRSEGINPHNFNNLYSNNHHIRIFTLKLFFKLHEPNIKLIYNLTKYAYTPDSNNRYHKKSTDVMVLKWMSTSDLHTYEL